MKRTGLIMMLALMLPAFLLAEDPRLATLKDRSSGLVSRQVVAKMMVKDRILEVGPVLNAILKDTREEEKMRLFAMKYLGEMQYKGCSPTLVEITKNKDLSMDFRKICVETVGAIDDKQTYIEMGTGILLRDDVANVLSQTYVDQIEKSKLKEDPDIISMLGQFMTRSVKDVVKLKALDILAAHPSKENLTLIMISLSEKNPVVRKKAVPVVAKLAQADAVTLFISKLEEETDDEVRAIYAEELNKLPMPKVRSIWVGDLAFWVAEETVEPIKKNLASALVKLKAANKGSGLSGPDISMPRNPRPVPKPGKKR